MTHAYLHGIASAQQFGGKASDYLPIHEWFNESPDPIFDLTPRARRHHVEGVLQAEMKFGLTITNSDGRRVLVRSIGEQHVKQECGGRLPHLSDWMLIIQPIRCLFGQPLFKERLKKGIANG